MYEATLRFAGADAGPYAAATAGTDLRLSVWCNDRCDLISVRGGDPDPVRGAVAEVVGVRDAVGDGTETVIVTGDCLVEHAPAVDPHLARHGVLLAPPLTYEDGAKRCRVLALDPGALSAAYRDLAGAFDVTVESKRELRRVAPPLRGPPALSHPAADLTERQREALWTAFEAGYYERPRETTTAAVADRMGVARRTVEEHLRRAERKVVAAVVASGGYGYGRGNESD